MGPIPHQLDAVTLAALTRQWVTAYAHDEPAAAAIAMQIVDNLLGTFGNFEHTRRIPDGAAQVIEPGVHINTRPPGHVLIVDDKRETLILDHGGVVQIAGVDVTDWPQLTELGRHLTAMGQAKSGQQPDAAASAPADHMPRRAELLDFARSVAHLTAEGDDIDGEAFVMENDDAWATLNAVIEQARQLLGITVPQGSM